MRTIHISIPLVVIVIASTILMIVHTKEWAGVMAIALVGLVVLYFLKDTIDWKYYLKNPPELEKPLQGILHTIPFYKQLNTLERKNFEQRISLFMLAHEYKIQPTRKSAEDESIEAAEDIKLICSIPAIILTFYEIEFLMKEVEQIVLYNHPFPTPRYQQLHSCESNKEDKVLIFSLPHLEKGVKEPFTYFDVGMYEWARISENISYDCQDWNHFEAKTGVGKNAYESVIGLSHIDLPAVCRVTEIHHSYIKNVS